MTLDEYPDNDFVFMQDSAPSHRAKATQNYCLRNNVPDFTSSLEWTPHSPDLNPLDYSVWDILQELGYKGRHEPFANLEDLQNVIRDKWHDVDDQTVRKAILQWKTDINKLDNLINRALCKIFSRLYLTVTTSYTCVRSSAYPLYLIYLNEEGKLLSII